MAANSKVKWGRLIRVYCAAELPKCPNCGEPWCREHKMHWADCPCIGPHNAEEEGYELIERNGRLYARRRPEN